MSTQKVASLVEVQRRVSEVVEKATGLRVVSFDKLEGIDSLRPCFIVDAVLSNRSLMMKSWAENEVAVDVYYYGSSSADCKRMADTLGEVFINPLKIHDVIVVPDDLSADIQSQYVLAFGMNVSFRSSVQARFIDITMGEVPHVSDHNTEPMEEVYVNDSVWKKEE